MRGVFGVKRDVLEAYRAHQRDRCSAGPHCQQVGMGLFLAIEFSDQPGCAQRCVACHCAMTREQSIRRKPDQLPA